MIWDYLCKRNVGLASMQCCGADGVAINTRNKKGVVTGIETTWASKYVFRMQAPDGFLRARLLERQLNSVFETKSDLKPI